jgi:hypothetical protein
VCWSQLRLHCATSAEQQEGTCATECMEQPVDGIPTRPKCIAVFLPPECGEATHAAYLRQPYLNPPLPPPPTSLLAATSLPLLLLMLLQ